MSATAWLARVAPFDAAGLINEYSQNATLVKNGQAITFVSLATSVAVTTDAGRRRRIEPKDSRQSLRQKFLILFRYTGRLGRYIHNETVRLRSRRRG